MNKVRCGNKKLVARLKTGVSGSGVCTPYHQAMKPAHDEFVGITLNRNPSINLCLQNLNSKYSVRSFKELYSI